MHSTYSAADASRSTPAAEENSAYAAIDLGTNNCRLLIARAQDDIHGSAGKDLHVLDAYSRIVRLGEGVSASGNLTETAMSRTLNALKQCQKKIEKYQLENARFVATDACRRAGNSDVFLRMVKEETGLTLDIISTEEEAKLAFLGCASLMEQTTPYALMFDIGGGSTELMWINNKDAKNNNGDYSYLSKYLIDWTSVSLGVMNLADRFGGPSMTDIMFEDMVKLVTEQAEQFDKKQHIGEKIAAGEVQLLSTSGTVTTLAAVFLDLPRYDRNKIDGVTLSVDDIHRTTKRLLAMRPSERFNHPCIGHDRADYIIAGCAIFYALSTLWPTKTITIADRGVREGIILSLMQPNG